MMFKTKRILILTVILSFVLTGCQTNEPLKIGVIGTMTGSNSDLSVSGRRGIELAVDELNAKGGINGHLIELVVKDDENLTEVALERSKELINENVKFIIGHYTSGMTLATIDYMNKQDVLVLGPTISADSLSGIDDNFIRFIASTKEQANVIENAALMQNKRKISILFDEKNKGFTDALVKNFIDLHTLNGNNSPSVYSFNMDDPNRIEEVLVEIKTERPDGLFIIASAEDSAYIATLIQKMAFKVQLYGPLWANTNQLLRKGGEAVEGMLVVGAYNPNSTSKGFVDFKANYKERFGSEPTFSSVFSYEAMMALALSIEKSDRLSPEIVKQNMIKISSFDGVESTFSIDKFGDNTRDYMMFKIKNGVFEELR